jgi:hypothetical protein
MRKWLFCLFPLFGEALEVQPWFGDCLEFHFLGSYAYSFFDKVNKGVPQLQHTFSIWVDQEQMLIRKWAILAGSQEAPNRLICAGPPYSAHPLRHLPCRTARC